VAEAKRLYRANFKTGKRRSLREISAELAKAEFLNETGKPYHPWRLHSRPKIAGQQEGALIRCEWDVLFVL